MNKDRDQMVERLMNLTLEILFRITGEDYIMVKTSSCQAPVSEEWGGFLSPIPGSPPSRIHEAINDQKILELIYKMIELLTGEVPIRCQDVTIYFSMEEWEYLEEHKDQYKDVMMEENPPRTSPVRTSKRTTPETHPGAQDWSQDHQMPLLSQLVNQDEVLHHCPTTDIIEEEEKYVRGDEQCKKETPTDDGSVRTSKRTTPERHPGAQDWSPLHQMPLFSQLLDQDHCPTTDIMEEEKKYVRGDEQCKMVTPTDDGSGDCNKGAGGHLTSNLKAENPDNSQDTHEYLATLKGNKSFSCSECKKCFINNARLVVHQRIHTGEKPFSCSECDKSFKQKAHLVSHLRIHTGEKRYSCSECEKCFQRSQDLVIHQRTHTGEKPYSCLECGKCYNNKSVLVKHKKIHTGEKPYSCSDCGKRFPARSALFRHLKTHTSEKPNTGVSQ
ncbi:gastrula zinc finger protein XlCGF66.1-like [Anomaloglossus baeobatrachus]|uniref:gastrula zinc finger protein XlCGF66.1-like n=1 Tax=Anomaloglossus baeobatrachus TaxID=238106 RepID=UPI003F4FBB45